MYPPTGHQDMNQGPGNGAGTANVTDAPQDMTGGTTGNTNPTAVVSDIKSKIDREMKLIQGFQALKRNTTNPEVIQRCNTQIRETQSNIDYLTETLNKLTVSAGANNANNGNNRPLYSRFDLIKYDGPSLGHRIQYMLQQLQFKLQVENQYKQANEKISQLYLMDGDKTSSNAAEGGKVESDHRIQLLNKALKRYQDMHVDIEEIARDMEIMNPSKFARNSLSGKLYLTITCVRDIDHIASPMFSKRPESVVVIKIDDVERARTKGSRSGKWNEDFVIDVDKSNEVELSVYDKMDKTSTPVAITWALLSDIAEELRKKKNGEREGWVSASLMTGINNNSTSDSSFPSDSNSGIGSLSGSSSATQVSNQNSATSASTTSKASNNRVAINTWINLEPIGHMLVTISFEKQSGKQFMGPLGRHGAIRQRKEEVFSQHGHQFVQKQFYNIMCCALCGEFLRYTGYQCQDCKLLCHKKCYQKVVTKCISTSTTDSDEAKLNHRIPHRFEPTLNRGTKWCCHCGYILPWGRKNVRKCTECGVMCHAQCTHLVPDFCGMSMDMANKILSTIKATTPRLPVKVPNQLATQKYSPNKPLPPKGNVGFPPMETTPISSNQLESDDEDEKYDATLPTDTTVQQQIPVEYPRRKPPPEQQQQQQYQQQYQQQIQESHNYQDKQAQMDYPIQNIPYGQQEINQPIPYLASQDPFKDQRFQSHSPSPAPSPPIHDDSLKLQTDQVQGPDDTFASFDYNNNNTQAQIATQVPEPPRNRRRKKKKIGLDDFQFLAVLGKGNFGKVMLAESRHTNKLCAIKVLKKDFIVENDEAESVKSEKRVFLTANKEKHPFLLNLHCCFQTENRIYFVMEYISGGDLMWHIQKNRFSAKRAKFYACEVLLALKHFHENGIVYRDLKLDNILLTAKGHIKIADYGLCKENMWRGNTTGTFCGTPEFMAPEIVSGKPYDRTVDWWAFGVLLFQMLLCQSPFKGDDEDEIFNAIEHDDVKYPISMPRQTVLVLQALLTKDPSQRLGSSERDALDIMEHPYFRDVNFDDVLNCRIQPPYFPELSNEHDCSNFDKEFTSETPRLTPVDTVLTSEMQEQFRGFSHIAEEAVIL